MEPMNENANKEQAAGQSEIPVTPPVTPVTEVKSAPAFDAKDVEDHKFVAALSYICILFLVPLLLKRESPFAQFHAKQGLVVCIVWFVGSFVFWIPLLGWGAALVLFVANIMAIIKALQGEAWEIPWVKDVVKKLNI